MSINLSSAGAANLGALVSPAYTFTSDGSTDPNAKAFVVTALGGTQTGVVVHSNVTPFRVIIKRIKNVKLPGARNAVTGQYLTNGKNNYEMLIVKGQSVNGSTNPQYDTSLIRTQFSISSLAANDLPNLQALFASQQALMSALISSLYQLSQDNVL